MKRYCDTGCRRPAHGEWIHPTNGVFAFSHLCNLQHRDALTAQGWLYYPPLDTRDDEAPLVTQIGGPNDCG